MVHNAELFDRSASYWKIDKFPIPMYGFTQVRPIVMSQQNGDFQAIILKVGYLFNIEHCEGV